MQVKKVVDFGFLKKTSVYNSFEEAEADQNGREGKIVVELEGSEYQNLINQIKTLRAENLKLTNEKNQVIQLAKSKNFDIEMLKRKANEKFRELEEQLADAERRRAGLYEAINRWKSKAQGKPLPGEEITRVERRNDQNYVLISRRIVKAPQDPLLWKEAWSCLSEEEKKVTERIFFDKHTWVQVYRQEF